MNDSFEIIIIRLNSNKPNSSPTELPRYIESLARLTHSMWLFLFVMCTGTVHGWGRMNGAPEQLRTASTTPMVGTTTTTTTTSGRSSTNTTATSVRFTCAGAVRTPLVEQTIRNENPNVPVALISRLPMQDRTFRFFNALHVYGVLVLAPTLLVQLFFRKGTAFHVSRGRVVSYAIMPAFLVSAWVLQCLAISKDVDDYWTAPPLIDYRGQVSYIVPFGLHVVVCAFVAFYVYRFDWCDARVVQVLACVEVVSIVWGLSIGLYVNCTMMAGGRADFGMGKLMWDDLVEGGVRAPAATPFYQWLGSVLVLGTVWQLVLDAFTLKVLLLMRCHRIQWTEQHKIAVLMLFAQGAFITSAFVAFFPYCVFGWAEWTCIDNVYMTLPIVCLFELPLLPYLPWIFTFVRKVVNMDSVGPLLT